MINLMKFCDKSYEIDLRYKFPGIDCKHKIIRFSSESRSIGHDRGLKTISIIMDIQFRSQFPFEESGEKFAVHYVSNVILPNSGLESSRGGLPDAGEVIIVVSTGHYTRA